MMVQVDQVSAIDVRADEEKRGNIQLSCVPSHVSLYVSLGVLNAMQSRIVDVDVDMALPLPSEAVSSSMADLDNEEVVLPPKLRFKQHQQHQLSSSPPRLDRSQGQDLNVLLSDDALDSGLEDWGLRRSARHQGHAERPPPRYSEERIEDDWQIFATGRKKRLSRVGRVPSDLVNDHPSSKRHLPSRFSDRHKTFIKSYRSDEDDDDDDENGELGPSTDDPDLDVDVDIDDSMPEDDDNSLRPFASNSRKRTRSSSHPRKGQLVSDDDRDSSAPYHSGSNDNPNDDDDDDGDDDDDDVDDDEAHSVVRPRKHKLVPLSKGLGAFGTLIGWLDPDDRHSHRMIDAILRHRCCPSSDAGITNTLSSDGPATSSSITESIKEKSWKNGDVEFLIKWRGFSHLHNEWLSYPVLKNARVAPGKLRKLDIYIQTALEEQESLAFMDKENLEEMAVEKELSLALARDYVKMEAVLDITEYKSRTFYLVKWKSLMEKDATWEEEAAICHQENFKLLVDRFQDREFSPSAGGTARMPSSRAVPTIITNPKKRPAFVAYKSQPSWILKECQLRDYQLQGVNWLAYCWHNNVNSILADEMGLGKTIQSISFLNYLFSEMKLDGPFLLVVPLSTIHNWQKEFVKWAPGLQVLLYMGDAASRDVMLEYEWHPRRMDGKHDKTHFKWNVLLTTYEFIIRDKSLLSNNIGWQALIVDEAHRLKNESSLLHVTLRDNFTFYHRVLITGTPLQNSLKELYALLSFLEPEKFPEDWDTFSSTYLQVDEDQPEGDSQPHTQTKGIGYLHSILKPHLLRRLKKDVEKSLPLKKERILRVELSPLQKLLYRWILTRNYKELNRSFNSLSTNSTKNSTTSLSLLNIIGELKKASSHPYLFPNGQTDLARSLDPEGIIYHSGKMILLDALLKRLLQDKHRVLIFSQSVKMLDLLGEFLQLRNWPHLRLDGSVPSDQRKRSIERFNTPGSIYNIFLLSTRAGGLGINLETADTVVLFDSDWNPQNDLQAMARAHRIGQKNFVNVYRLVSKNSVEEEILERAKRKMILDHVVIQRIGKKHGAAGEQSIAPGAGDLQKILLFSAKALFASDEGPSINEGDDFEEKLAWHKLMTSTGASNKKWQYNDIKDSEDGDVPQTHTDETMHMESQGEELPPSVKAILTKPGTFNFDLDSVLKRSEEDDGEEAEENVDEVADPEENADDKNFLDSFKVADLSSALSWSAIIPQQERASLETADALLKQLKDSEDLKKSMLKRQKAKELTLKRMAACQPLSKEERLRIKEDERREKELEKLRAAEASKAGSDRTHSEKSTSRMEEFFKELAKHHDVAFSHEDVKAVVKALWAYGSPENEHFIDEVRIMTGSNELPMKTDTIKLLVDLIKQAATKSYLEFQANPPPTQPKLVNDKVAANGAERALVYRTYFYGSPLYPHNLLKRLSRLEALHRAISGSPSANHESNDFVAYMTTTITSSFFRLPINWSCGWTMEDDVFLLRETWKHGHWNFEALKDHVVLGPKIAGIFLPRPTKKETAAPQVEEASEKETAVAKPGDAHMSDDVVELRSDVDQQASEAPLSVTTTPLHSYPSEDQLRKRVDYLLDCIYYNYHPEERPARKGTAKTASKGEKKVASETKKDSKAGGNSAAIESGSKKKSTSKSPSLFETWSKKAGVSKSPHFTAKEISGTPTLTRIFKNLFKGHKKTLLLLDALESPTVLSSTEEITLVKNVLLEVGSFIAHHLGTIILDEGLSPHLEPQLLQSLLEELGPDMVAKWYAQDAAALRMSCWNFVSLCWPTEIDAIELSLLYQRLAQ